MGKLELTENEKRDVIATTMLVFLALVAGVMLGYGWCLVGGFDLDTKRMAASFLEVSSGHPLA